MVASFSLLVIFITLISNFCNVYFVSFKVFHVNQFHFKRKTGHLTLKVFKITLSTDARATEGPTKVINLTKGIEKMKNEPYINRTQNVENVILGEKKNT